MTQDMSQVIVPRSDQINADDFLSGPRTVRIKSVAITPGTEQPVTIELEDSKPWRPCKSMSRLLVAAWGPDAKEYAGRSVTLYCDPKVKWGGMEVGGIRVSHMSHIDSDLVLALTMTKGKKAPTRVKPLKADVAPLKVVAKAASRETEPASDGYDFDGLSMMVAEAFVLAEGATGSQGLKEWWETMKPDRMKAGAADRARAIEIADMVKAKIAELETKEGEV
jgi:hypothetical protein